MKRALEKSMAAFLKNQRLEEDIFVRLVLDKKEDEIFLSMSTSDSVTPMLFFEGTGLSSSLWQKNLLDEIKDKHLHALKHCKSLGYKKAVIAADDDGFLAHMLSPRFSDWSLEERMALLLAIFREGKEIVDELWVLLMAEELIPGGMDASDGIAIAKSLEKEGLETIIVASGTKDFMPLYERKTTKKKISQEEEFSSGEPTLASSIWVRHHTNLALWALAEVDDEEEASKLAQSIGLQGIVSRQGF